MNNIGINTTVFANVVTPFSPVGKQAVGLENADAKEEVFAPVEQSTESSKSLNRDTEESRRTGAETEEERVTDRNEQQEQDQQQEQQRRDQEIIRDLAARDREVRAHEQAHAAVGGQYAGAPSYTFQRGPDGVNYAVAGEVPISLPANLSDPEAALAAAEQVRRAALAPAEPSAQDRSIAARAANLAIEARAEIQAQQQQEQRVERETAAQETTERREEEEQREERLREQQLREDRLEELRIASRRSQQLSNQLITGEAVERTVGAVLDQLA